MNIHVRVQNASRARKNITYIVVVLLSVNCYFSL